MYRSFGAEVIPKTKSQKILRHGFHHETMLCFEKIVGMSFHLTMTHDRSSVQ